MNCQYIVIQSDILQFPATTLTPNSRAFSLVSSIALRPNCREFRPNPIAFSTSLLKDAVMSEKPPHREYWAFISYSQIDTDWGKWLHRALEQYQVPKRLAGRETERGYKVPKRAFPVFLDREELPTSANFGRMIETALESAKYLVVICSPNSAKSKWVNEEIRAFKKMGREDRILCLIVDGEPNASDGKPGFSVEDECFAPALRFQADESGSPTEHRLEPLAADARPGRDGKTNAKLKILAGVLGVAYDELVQRDHARRMRRMWSFTALSLALMSIMAALAVLFLLERNRAQEALSARYELAGRETYLDSQFGESILYFDAARKLGRELENDPAFASAWSHCRNLRDQFRTGRAPVFSTFTPDSTQLLVQDQLGGILIRDLVKRETVWRSLPGSVECSTAAFNGDYAIGLVNSANGKQLEVRQISTQAQVFTKPWPESWTNVRDLMVSQDGRYAFYRKIPAVPGETERQAVIALQEDGREVEIDSVKSLNLASWWFGPDATLLYHAEVEGFTGMALRVWSRESGKLLKEIAIQQKIQSHAQTGDRLVLGFEGGMIGCLNPATLEVLWTWQSDSMPAPAIELAILGEHVHSVDGMSQMRTLSLLDGTLLTESQGSPGAIETGSLGNGSLTTGDRNGVLRIWNESGLQLEEAWHPDALSTVASSPDSELAMAGARNGLVRIWDVQSPSSTSGIQVLRQDGDPFRMIQNVVNGESGFLLATDAGLIRKSGNGENEAIGKDPYWDLVPLPNGELVGISAKGEMVWLSPGGAVKQRSTLPENFAGSPFYKLAVGGERLFVLATEKGWAPISSDGSTGEITELPSSLSGKPVSAFRTNSDGSEVLVAGFGGIARWDANGDLSTLDQPVAVERIFEWKGDTVLWRNPGFALQQANFRDGKVRTLAPQVASATLLPWKAETLVAFSTPKGEVSVQTLAGEQISWFQHPQSKSAGSDVLLQNAAQPGGGMVLSPDGRFLATSHGFAAYLWDWRKGALAWKSPKLPAGMFGQLTIDRFLPDHQLLIFEGMSMPGQGFPGAYLLSVPLETPTSEEVMQFGAEILQLQMENGLLHRLP